MSVVSRNPFDLLGGQFQGPTAIAGTPKAEPSLPRLSIDDGSEPAVTSQPKTTTPAKPAAAAATAAAAPREIPGSKPPRGRGGDAAAARGTRGGQYYSRGGPRNVIKGEGQAAEVSAVEPESGFEGERRGQWGPKRSLEAGKTDSQSPPYSSIPRSRCPTR